MCLPLKPFKLEKEWIHNGLKCAVVQAREHGHRCGYVRLPPTHPQYQEHYDNFDVSVHGGLTFSDIEPCIEEDGTGWWIGFDCAHSGDAMYDPNNIPEHKQLHNFPQDHYWTHDEVVSETEQLAMQLA